MDSHRQRLNDQRHRRSAGDGKAPIAFVCECGDPACLETVVLTGRQYRLIRPRAILHAEHGIATAPPPPQAHEVIT